jgi:predicted HicB family RNase H-like nuclease
MSNLLTYKGFYGSAEYSHEDGVFCGEIEFINDLITFEADTEEELEKEFSAAVDHYLVTCQKLNRKPQKAFRGQLNIRITPDLHRKAAIIALKRNIPLNKLVEMALSREVQNDAGAHGR